MRAPINGVMMIGGTISSLSFSPNKDKAYVKFKNENNFVFEFSNKKKPRADHVRKLRLKVGESVLAIGAISGGSNVYGFGYEISRDGKVSEDGYSILRGKVLRIIKTKKTNLLVLESQDEKKEYTVTCGSGATKDVFAGDTVVCMCFDYSVAECKNQCRFAAPEKCGNCEKKYKEKRYSAFRVEKEELK